MLETNTENYRAKLKNEWNRLVAEDILTTDFVDRFVEKTKARIANEVKTNAEIWPTSAWYYKDKNNFEQEVELIKKYVQLRIPQIESYLSAL